MLFPPTIPIDPLATSTTFCDCRLLREWSLALILFALLSYSREMKLRVTDNLDLGKRTFIYWDDVIMYKESPYINIKFPLRINSNLSLINSPNKITQNSLKPIHAKSHGRRDWKIDR